VYFPMHTLSRQFHHCCPLLPAVGLSLAGCESCASTFLREAFFLGFVNDSCLWGSGVALHYILAWVLWTQDVIYPPWQSFEVGIIIVLTFPMRREKLAKDLSRWFIPVREYHRGFLLPVDPKWIPGTCPRGRGAVVLAKHGTSA
jgi:hypothetical protein